MFPSALSARKQYGRMPLKLAMQARPSAERQGWELLNVLVNSRSCFVFVLYLYHKTKKKVHKERKTLF